MVHLQSFIGQSSVSQATPGDLGAEFTQESVLLPKDIYAIAVSTVQSESMTMLHAVLKTLPASFQMELRQKGWTDTQIQQGIDDLCAQIEAHIPELGQPDEKMERVFGAMGSGKWES